MACKPRKVKVRRFCNHTHSLGCKAFATAVVRQWASSCLPTLSTEGRMHAAQCQSGSPAYGRGLLATQLNCRDSEGAGGAVRHVGAHQGMHGRCACCLRCRRRLLCVCTDCLES